MAKAKARKGPSVLRTKTEPKKVNPFELKKTRTKFDVVGRRLKGTTKNVVQARQDAHNKVWIEGKPSAQALGADDAQSSQPQGCKHALRDATRQTPPRSQQRPRAQFQTSAASYAVTIRVARWPIARQTKTRLISVSCPCLQRKSTLLVEYKALRKANTFKDRRLGGEQLLRMRTE